MVSTGQVILPSSPAKSQVASAAPLWAYPSSSTESIMSATRCTTSGCSARKASVNQLPIRVEVRPEVPS